MAGAPGTARKEVITEVVRNLQHLFRAVDTFSKRTLQEFGVSGPQLWALRTVHGSGEITVGGLADGMYLHISTVSGIVDRLQERGLVTRVRSDHDRRVVRLRLTPRGRALLRRAPEPPRSRVPAALQRLETRKLRTVREGTRQILKIMRLDAPGA